MSNGKLPRNLLFLISLKIDFPAIQGSCVCVENNFAVSLNFARNTI